MLVPGIYYPARQGGQGCRRAICAGRGVSTCLLVCLPTQKFRANLVDDADAVDGAPCCVQLVGRNMREEELLDMTETVSNVLTG